MEQFPSEQKDSGINRAIGFEPEKEESLLQYFKNKFENNSSDFKEKEKTIEQTELINRINNKMLEFLARYGINAIKVPIDNIHIVDRTNFTEDEFKKIQNKFGTEFGFYSALKQSITIFRDYDISKLSFLQILVHEILHLQSFYSYQKSDTESADLTLEKDEQTASINIRRSGFSIGTKDGKKLLFHKINESIITELGIRFEKEYTTKWPELQKEIKNRDAYIEHVAERDHIDIEIVKKTVAGIKKDEYGEYKWLSYEYHEERKQLNLLIDDLFNKNKDDFEDREQIFSLFAEATINGNILPVARLIEKTFGKGSFRILGEKSADKQEQD